MEFPLRTLFTACWGETRMIKNVRRSRRMRGNKIPEFAKVVTGRTNKTIKLEVHE